MSFSSEVMGKIDKYPELEIIDTQAIYKENFENNSERAFYKAISRMAENEEINRIGKGIYCKPKLSKFGKILSGEKNILDYYLGTNKDKGVVIGYLMYNKKGLTTQMPKTVELYSRVSFQEKKTIKNVIIYNANTKFDTPTIKMIELLEVLQNYKTIEDLNQTKLINFIENTVQYYNDRCLENLLETISYKKSTLASLKSSLDYFEIENTVSQYLRETSNYKMIRMEELYEVTS